MFQLTHLARRAMTDLRTDRPAGWRQRADFVILPPRSFDDRQRQHA
jgi:hypothetical protein